MSVVIHNIKGNGYAYEHHRVGNKVVCDYLGRYSGKGEINKGTEIYKPKVTQQDKNFNGSEWKEKESIKAYQERLNEMTQDEIKADGVKIQDDYNDMQNYNALKEWYEQNPRELDSRVTTALSLDIATSRGKGKTVFPVTQAENIKIRKIYLNTQAFLKNEGENITAYRGIDGDGMKAFKNSNVGDMILAQTYNISSWSEDKTQAERFARGITDGAVIEAKIKKEQIFLYYKNSVEGIEKEKELVVIGTKIPSKIIYYKK